MTRLLITRGLPASGKTTFARKLAPRVIGVNRDDLRRDADRPDAERVGAENIRRMHSRYLAGRNLPLPVPWVDTGGRDAVDDPAEGDY